MTATNHAQRLRANRPAAVIIWTTPTRRLHRPLANALPPHAWIESEKISPVSQLAPPIAVSAAPQRRLKSPERTTRNPSTRMPSGMATRPSPTDAAHSDRATTSIAWLPYGLPEIQSRPQRIGPDGYPVVREVQHAVYPGVIARPLGTAPAVRVAGP